MKKLNPDPALLKLMNLPEVVSWKAILMAQHAIYSKLESALYKEGCSITRFRVLLVLYFEGPTTAASFTKRLLLSRSNLSKLLRRILKDGLIKADEESPSVARPHYCLTKQGRTELERLFPGHIRRITELVPKLDTGTIASLQKIENFQEKE